MHKYHQLSNTSGSNNLQHFRKKSGNFEWNSVLIICLRFYFVTWHWALGILAHLLKMVQHGTSINTSQSSSDVRWARIPRGNPTFTTQINYSCKIHVGIYIYIHIYYIYTSPMDGMGQKTLMFFCCLFRKQIQGPQPPSACRVTTFRDSFPFFVGLTETGGGIAILFQLM